MSDYPDLDDLFGPDTVSGQGENDPYPDLALPAASSNLPVPLPMPMPMSLPLPTPAASQEVSRDTPQAPGQGSTLQLTAEQERELRALLQKAAASGPGSSQQASSGSDPLMQQLLQRYGPSLSSLLPPVPSSSAPVGGSSPKPAYDRALTTQLQPKVNPPPRGARISHSRNKTSANRINEYDWYDTYPVRENWVAFDGDKPVRIEYNHFGELRMAQTFNRSSLEAYIRGCAREGIPLRLWIQNSATTHSERFFTPMSYVCRAQDCPVKGGSIGRGMFQVCLDEHPAETSNGRLDPFHVAGFMHLFCLEEMISVAELMTFADVQADVRTLPLEERNPMSLARDGSAGKGMYLAYNEWRHQFHDQYVHGGLAVPLARRRSSTQRLYRYLTIKKMECEPGTRQRMRERRNGFDISKHKGNLRKLVDYRENERKKRKRARNDSGSDGASPPPAQRRSARQAGGTGSTGSSPGPRAAAITRRTSPPPPVQIPLPSPRLNTPANHGDLFADIDIPQVNAEEALHILNMPFRWDEQQTQLHLAEWDRQHAQPSSQQQQQPQQTPRTPRTPYSAHYNLRNTKARRESMERRSPIEPPPSQQQQQQPESIGFEDGGLFLNADFNIDPFLLSQSPLNMELLDGASPRMPGQSPTQQQRRPSTPRSQRMLATPRRHLHPATPRSPPRFQPTKQPLELLPSPLPPPSPLRRQMEAEGGASSPTRKRKASDMQRQHGEPDDSRRRVTRSMSRSMASPSGVPPTPRPAQPSPLRRTLSQRSLLRPSPTQAQRPTATDAAEAYNELYFSNLFGDDDDGADYVLQYPGAEGLV